MSSMSFELSIPPGSMRLLREVVAQRDPTLLYLLEPGARLERSNISDLTRTIAAEFVASEVGEDYEPTERGLRLEALLDEINRHGFS